MPLAGHFAPAAALDVTSLLFGTATLIVSITILAICTCCGRNAKKREDDGDVYGEVNPAAVTVASGESPAARTINFRSIGKSGRLVDRHSQPATIRNGIPHASMRASAPLHPARALPQLPADLYTAIDKTRKPDDLQFADDTVHPMYECIYTETDSFADPLYSKVGDVRSVPVRDRKYDYPVFAGRTTTDGRRDNTDEVLYQSASQIYAAGSEDPYSSINSEPRAGASGEADGDTSSAYDPGYAKVTASNSKESKKRDKIEKTERELDLLYSKIRRHAHETDEDYSAQGPSFRPDPIQVPVVEPIVANNQQFDNQSVSSREPSYRYITMRESADLVRERLRQQGQLGPPIREHYYSTIGNEYETVDGNSSINGAARPTEIRLATNIDRTFNPLSVSMMAAPEVAPPPPTSPIPDRTPSLSDVNHTLLSHRDVSRRSPVPPLSNLQDQHTAPMYAVVSKSRDRTSGRVISTFEATPEPLLHASLANSSGFSGIPQRPPSSRENTVAQINEFMHRPTLPYRSLDTLIGRRTVEERERIVEKRSSVASGAAIQIDGPPQVNDVMSRSVDADNGMWRAQSSNVHHVEIQRIPASNRASFGPSANDIISARRYRGSNGRIDPFSPSNQHNTSSSSGDTQNTDSAQVSSSTAAALPTIAAEPSGLVSGASTSRTSARRGKPWKDETEEEKIKRLGTIYTANDYISSIDMSNERPWPISSRRDPSPANPDSTSK